MRLANTYKFYRKEEVTPGEEASWVTEFLVVRLVSMDRDGREVRD